MLSLVWGGNDLVAPDLYHSIKVLGMLHVIAASGYNVSLVLRLANGFLSRLVSKKVIIFIFLALILGYASLSEYSPSVVRAASMAIVSQVSKLISSRRLSLSRTFLFGVCLATLVSPGVLLETSFHLSCLAIVGLIHFTASQIRTGDEAGLADTCDSASLQLKILAALLKTGKTVPWWVRLREELSLKFKMYWYVQLWILPYSVNFFGVWQPLSFAPCILFQDFWEPLTQVGFLWLLGLLSCLVIPDLNIILKVVGDYLYIIFLPIVRLFISLADLPWPQVNVPLIVRPFVFGFWILLGINWLKISKNAK